LTSEEVVLERAVAGRTSRRIMEGLVYVPEELFSGK
jgi:2-methylaconitate cis-trans-isomerase PrpF